MTGDDLSRQIIRATLADCKYQGLLRQLTLTARLETFLDSIQIEVLTEESRYEDIDREAWHHRATVVRTSWFPDLLFVRMFGRRYVMYQLRRQIERVLKHELKEALIYRGKYWSNPHPELEHYKKKSH